MVLNSQDEANRACEREGWETIHHKIDAVDELLGDLEVAIRAAREANYGRKVDEVVLGAAEGPDGDPFAAWPEHGQP